ncbi:MAG TPA: hypothetical protein VN843_00450, partial [Anaerolineales bacterium]|nr:hypothetical protein [Anaerolineales bacterium]
FTFSFHLSLLSFGRHLSMLPSPEMHKDADITWYPAYRAVEWLICYPASPSEVSELFGFKQNRTISRPLTRYCHMVFEC